MKRALSEDEEEDMTDLHRDKRARPPPFCPLNVLTTDHWRAIASHLTNAVDWLVMLRICWTIRGALYSVHDLFERVIQTKRCLEYGPPHGLDMPWVLGMRDAAPFWRYFRRETRLAQQLRTLPRVSGAWGIAGGAVRSALLQTIRACADRGMLPRGSYAHAALRDDYDDIDYWIDVPAIDDERLMPLQATSGPNGWWSRTPLAFETGKQQFCAFDRVGKHERTVYIAACACHDMVMPWQRRPIDCFDMTCVQFAVCDDDDNWFNKGGGGGDDGTTPVRLEWTMAALVSLVTGVATVRAHLSPEQLRLDWVDDDDGRGEVDDPDSLPCIYSPTTYRLLQRILKYGKQRGHTFTGVDMSRVERAVAFPVNTVHHPMPVAEPLSRGLANRWRARLSCLPGIHPEPTLLPYVNQLSERTRESWLSLLTRMAVQDEDDY